MPYLESFFYYIVVVLLMFVILFGGALFLYMSFGQFKIFFAKEEVTLDIEKNLLYSLVKNRIFKFFILAYFATFCFFYLNQATDYFSDERAYPQAKAYKIVADLVLFHYDFFIAHRNLYYRPIGLKLIEPYQDVQEYLMQKGFEFIPKDDAERAIWRYEYFYSQYIRAMAAPIDFDKLTPDDLGYILRIGGHPAIYKAEAKEMLIEVEGIIESLMNNSMKDKYYDEVNRYMTTILFSVWWEKFSFLHYTLGVRTVHEHLSKDYNIILTQWTEDKDYFIRLNKFSNWLDITKDKIDNSQTLHKMMKNHQLIYPELMGLRVTLMSAITYAEMQYGELSCSNKMLQKYYIYKQEFLKYARNDIGYRRLSKQERLRASSLASSNLEDYILFKYCDVKAMNLELDSQVFIYSKTFNKTKKIIAGFDNGR